MKAFLFACTLLVSLPALAADGWDTQNWNTQDWNTWKNWKSEPQPDTRWQSRQRTQDNFLQRRNEVQEYQRQWSYDQRNRGYTQESQSDRYRAYDYGNRSYEYRSP